MHEREQSHFPDWAERERDGDLARIKENLDSFRLVAQLGYEVFGRGAIVVDTAQQLTGEDRPFGYSSQEKVEQSDIEEAKRMVEEYNPDRELVALFLKPQEHVSVYRIGVEVAPGADVTPTQVTQVTERHICQTSQVLPPLIDIAGKVIDEGRNKMQELIQRAEELEKSDRLSEAQSLLVDAEWYHHLTMRWEKIGIRNRDSLSSSEETEWYNVQPEDVLTEQEYHLLKQAEAGELSCPWCEEPLFGSFVRCSFLDDDGLQQYYSVKLECVCGFVSY